MAALLYFDETQNVNVKPGLIFFVQCSIASEQIFTIQSVKMWAQANEQVSHLHFVFRQSRATLQIYLLYITIFIKIIFILLVYQLEHSKILIVLVFHLKHYLCIINTKLTG